MSTDEAGPTAPSDDPPPPESGPEQRRGLSGPVRLLLPIALTAIILYAMKYADAILNPIFLALFLTMGASPALYWMRRKGLPPWACVVIVTIVSVAAVLLFVLIMLGAFTQLDEKLPTYKANLDRMVASAQAWFSARGIDIGGLSAGSFSPDAILDAARGVLGAAVDMLTSIFLLILIVLFMVAEAYAIPRRITEDRRMDDRFARSFRNFSDVTRTFLFTKAWLSAIVTVFVTLTYYLFGTDFAVVWGLLFFVLSFIPNIGFVLSVIPPFFVTLLEFGIGRAVAVTLIVIVVNTIVDNILSPKIMGRSVGLSSLTVFLSVIVWGWVLGGIGALISVPLTLMVKLLFFDSFDGTRTISDIMATPVRELGRRKRKKSRAEAEPGP
jgi:predicted PurR-regulated permease PerM